MLTATELAGQVPVLPGLRAGFGRSDQSSVRGWIEASWLMLAEGRAYLEDLEGGVDQPHMQQAVKLRLLEQLVDIDNRLAGRFPVPDQHCLAIALEYGLHELADVDGAGLITMFGLDEELGGPTCHVQGVAVFWQRLLAAFPGELPDRLVAQGQRDLLITLQVWAALARSVGLDVGLLTPMMKDA